MSHKQYRQSYLYENIFLKGCRNLNRNVLFYFFQIVFSLSCAAFYHSLGEISLQYLYVTYLLDVACQQQDKASIKTSRPLPLFSSSSFWPASCEECSENTVKARIEMSPISLCNTHAHTLVHRRMLNALLWLFKWALMLLARNTICE